MMSRTLDRVELNIGEGWSAVYDSDSFVCWEHEDERSITVDKRPLASLRMYRPANGRKKGESIYFIENDGKLGELLSESQIIDWVKEVLENLKPADYSADNIGENWKQNFITCNFFSWRHEDGRTMTVGKYGRPTLKMYHPPDGPNFCSAYLKWDEEYSEEMEEHLSDEEIIAWVTKTLVEKGNEQTHADEA